MTDIGLIKELKVTWNDGSVTTLKRPADINEWLTRFFKDNLFKLRVLEEA